MCQTCNKPGHLAKMCRSKATAPSTAEALCKCYGKPGHEKKDCAWVDMDCEACKKKGHTIWVCRKAQKVNTSTSPSPTAPSAAASPPPPKQQFLRNGVPANAATPTAVAAGDAWWTYRCKGCTLGIKDPDRVATICPHPHCKAKEPRTQDAKEKAAAQSFTCTKNALETERRVAVAGPGGDLPPTQEHQAILDSVKQLEEQIEMLMKFPNDEMADKLAEKRKELQKQKNKLPVQEAQEIRGQVAMYSTLAELETKSQKEMILLDEKYRIPSTCGRRRHEMLPWIRRPSTISSPPRKPR